MLKFVAVAAFIAVANAQYYSSPLGYAQPLLARYAAPAPLTVAHAPLAVAHAPLAVAHAPLAKIEENDPHPQYSYSYSVNDATTGDNKEQHESRDGDVVSGSYSLVEADGSRRIVDYTADPINGFNAVVHKEPNVATAPVAVAAPAPILRAAPAISYATPAISYTHAPIAPALRYAPALNYAAPSYATISHAPAYAAIAHAPIGTVGHSSPVIHLK